MTQFSLEINTRDTKSTPIYKHLFIWKNLVQAVENVMNGKARGGRKVHFSDIISNNASFANALSDVEPHQHFSGHQSIPYGVLQGNNKVVTQENSLNVSRITHSVTVPA